MSAREAPPRTTQQAEMEAFWTQQLAARGCNVGWGRDKAGEYHAEFARDAYTAWREAYARGRAAGIREAQAGIAGSCDATLLHTPAQPNNTEKLGNPNDAPKEY